MRTTKNAEIQQVSNEMNVKNNAKTLISSLETYATRLNAEYKSINAIFRAHLEVLLTASEDERKALYIAVYGYDHQKAVITAEDVAQIDKKDLMRLYKTYSNYVNEAGQVCKAVRDESGAEVWTFEPATAVSVASVVVNPLRRSLRGSEALQVVGGQFYTKDKGKYVTMTKKAAAEAIRTAKAEAEAKAKAKAEAEAIAEEDRKAGAELRAKAKSSK